MTDAKLRCSNVFQTSFNVCPMPVQTTLCRTIYTGRWLFTSLRLPVLAPTGCGLTRCSLGTFDHGLVRNGIDSDCLLRQAVEELPSIAGPTTVEPKREFVEVVFQVLMAYRSLMSSQDPALQQRCDSVLPRHQFRRGVLLTL